jgi:hypothetical protein
VLAAYWIAVFSFCDLSSLPFTLTTTVPSPPDVGKVTELMVAAPAESVVPVEVEPPGQVTWIAAFAIGPPGDGVEQVTFTVIESECWLPGF